MAGFLISDKQFTVPFGGTLGTRTFLPGVNKDVTPEMAEHWYVKAAGARYVDKLEDAHKSSPTALTSVRQARSNWEQAMRESLRAHATQMALRKDLEKLEKEFGVNTKAADREFEKANEAEIERLKSLTDEAVEAARAQEEQDAAGLSPAAAERRAAGSEEVANTQMDGLAKADAQKQATETTEQIQQAAGAPVSKPDAGASEIEKRAAGSDEAANTHPDGAPVKPEERREEPKASETKQADAKDAKDGKTEVAEAKKAEAPKK